MAKNKNYDVLDKMLSDSQSGGRASETVWVSDPRHPSGGYYIEVSGNQTLAETFKTVDDIERYLRS